MEQQHLPGISERNQLYCGDCLSVLDLIPDGSVDLIYIDPPFYSQRSYEMIWGEEAERFAFEDRWAGGINHYVNYLIERIRKMYAKLKNNGSFYLHLDWHISHYMKVELDKVFGYSNFRNEVVWHYLRWPATQKNFQRMHDVILFYSKNYRANKFNVLLGELSEGTLKRWRGKKSLVEYEGGVRLVTQMTDEDSSGRPLDDVWDIPVINSQAKERLGYPTQKPVVLLERIISASSDQGDVVMDAYCGCGTTLAAAQKLGRRWIGIDISQSAIRVVEQRLKKIGAINFEVHGLVKSLKQLRELEPFEFQNWAINAVYGQHSPRKVADMGIDGFTFMEHHPIQVKQTDHVGRPVIDNFAGVLQRQKEKRGMVIAFGFTSGAIDEVARLEREDKIKIELVKCAELVAGTVPFKIMV